VEPSHNLGLHQLAAQHKAASMPLMVHWLNTLGHLECC